MTLAELERAVAALVTVRTKQQREIRDGYLEAVRRGAIQDSDEHYLIYALGFVRGRSGGEHRQRQAPQQAEESRANA